jgi:LDH2 family malate/lactate/ureidoglycolate dehydrogenase
VQGQEKVLVPGDPEREMERVRLRQGIPLLPAVWSDLQMLAEKLQVAFVEV